MRSRIIFFLLLISYNYCFAQQNKLIIHGQVLLENGVSLPTANIIDLNSSIGTTTNLNGIFHLTLPKQATSIRVSYIGYKTIVKAITSIDIDQIQNDTLFLIFNLQKSTVDLKPVEINTSGFQQVYKEANVSIVDYEFYHDGILLLLLDNKEYKLKMIDKNNTPLSDLNIRKNPKKLFRDCFDKLHLQYSDRSYPINFNENAFYLDTGYDLTEFNRIASPFIASINNMLFLKEYGFDNKILLYSNLKKGTKEKQGFHLVVNEPDIIANQNYREEEIIRHKVKDAHMMGGNNPGIQVLLRKIERNEFYLEKIMKSPDYHPLFKINNSIFIFNHFVDSMFIYDAVGIYKDKFSINYHHQNGWAKEIIVEFEGQNIYAKFKKNSSIFLKKINPSSGNIVSEMKIEKHIFPENIKIRNGFAYYLFSNPHTQGGTSKLYRQVLN